MTHSLMNSIKQFFGLASTENSGYNLIPSDLSAMVSTKSLFGQFQKAGRLGVLPVIGKDNPGNWTSPYSGLKFTGVHGYGTVSFHNDSDGTAILPMHMGYIQAGAQNHAISTAAMLAKGQERRYCNARCVQVSQGGYLKTNEQWFFVLPLKLREEALRMRGKTGYGVLWNAIGRLGKRFGSSGRGHLDDVICKHRAALNVYDRQFELLPHQVGAVFFLNDQPVGIEIGPTAKYFKEVWTSLVNFCYGSAALELERSTPVQNRKDENPVRETSLVTLRRALETRRSEETRKSVQALADCSWSLTEDLVEESFLDMNLYTVQTPQFYGQVIRDQSTLVYASLFRTGLGV